MSTKLRSFFFGLGDFPGFDGILGGLRFHVSEDVIVSADHFHVNGFERVHFLGSGVLCFRGFAARAFATLQHERAHLSTSLEGTVGATFSRCRNV